LIDYLRWVELHIHMTVQELSLTCTRRPGQDPNRYSYDAHTTSTLSFTTRGEDLRSSIAATAFKADIVISAIKAQSETLKAGHETKESDIEAKKATEQTKLQAATELLAASKKRKQILRGIIYLR
jgi:hypothetical protein